MAMDCISSWQPGGRKLWLFRYRFAGRENMLALGAFPEVSLAAARSKRDEARKLVAEGTDPSVKRRLDKIAAATAALDDFPHNNASTIFAMQDMGLPNRDTL